ncbi:MAG: O-antigen ligase family protein [Actinobacteria bacterium]|nr:O-antigen ligase family protein [Actinomycetota bacterium]
MAEAVESQHQADSATYDVGRILDRIGAGFIYLAVVLIPLAVAPFAQDQVMGAKLITMRILVSLAAFTWCLKGMAEGFRVRWSVVFWPALCFLVLSLISTAFSISPLTSIFGTYQRYEGFLSLLTYTTLLFLSVQYFDEEQKVFGLAKVMVVTAVAVSIYGLLQFAGYDPIAWGAASFEKSRTIATLGNPIVLGGYLAVSLTVSVGLLITARNARWVAVWAAASTVIAASLLVTLSRGAWLGALAGVALAIILTARAHKNRRRCVMTGVAIVAILILITSFTLVIGDKTIVGSRLLSLANPLTGSGESRVEIWKSALSMTKERPVFGYGPDTFKLAFPLHETLASARLFPQTLADNAHNIILQTAATLGIPALIAFLAIFLIFYVELFRKRAVTAGAALFVAAVAAYFVQGLLSVTAVATSFLPWLAMGVALSPGAKEITATSRSTILKYAAMFAGILSVASIAQSAFFFAADVESGQGIMAIGHGDLQNGFAKLTTAASLNPFSDLYVRQLAGVMQGAARADENRERYNESLTTIKRAVKLAPDDVDNYIALGDFYAYGGVTYDSKYYDRAIEALDKAVELRKYSPSGHRILGLVYLKTGEARKALSELNKALEVDPRDARALLYEGQAYEKVGDKRGALEAYRTSFKARPDFIEAKKALDRLEKEI